MKNNKTRYNRAYFDKSQEDKKAKCHRLIDEAFKSDHYVLCILTSDDGVFLGENVNLVNFKKFIEDQVIEITNEAKELK